MPVLGIQAEFTEVLKMVPDQDIRQNIIASRGDGRERMTECCPLSRPRRRRRCWSWRAGYLLGVVGALRKPILLALNS